MTQSRERDFFSLSGAEISSRAFLERAGRAYVSGQDIDWSALYPDGGCCVSLPPYVWQRERLWFDPTADSTSLASSELTEALSSSSDAQEPQPALLLKLLEAPEEKRKTLLQEYLTGQVARLLAYASEQLLSPSQSLFAAGMRSATATCLMNHLQLTLRCTLSLVAVFNYPTIERLCGYLLTRIEQEHLAGAHATRQEDKLHRTCTALAHVDNLSEQEVVSSLLAKLADIERKLA
jgi:acyl transferase domain-containing protein